MMRTEMIGTIGDASNADATVAISSPISRGQGGGGEGRGTGLILRVLRVSHGLISAVLIRVVIGTCALLVLTRIRIRRVAS